MTQSELEVWVRKKFKLRAKPARNTISDIMKNAETIMSDTYGDDVQRKSTQVSSPQLAKRLSAWIMDMERRNICLPRELVTMKARELQVQLCDAWDLTSATAGSQRSCGATSCAIAYDIENLHQQTRMPFEKNCRNPTGLCYAMAPTRSICTKQMCGAKKKKTRIAMAMTANANDMDAQPILYIGHAKNPRCFNKKSAKELRLDYKVNKKAWITRVIFQDWLRGVDQYMCAANRHILLLLDNASSHDAGDLALTNVTVKHLPPNTTAFLQPMDAGIIASFKAAYKKKQLHWVYNKLRDPRRRQAGSVRNRSAPSYAVGRRGLT